MSGLKRKLDAEPNDEELFDDVDENDDDGDDDGESGEDGETGDGGEQDTQAADGSENATNDSAGNKKRERSNAKAVECLDLEGNLIEVFRSGMAASMKLGIPQGDISLCCRGMKPSVMGYKFRFSGEAEERQALRLKKGFVIDYGVMDNSNKTEVTRTTRASRGEYGQGARADLSAKSILDPPELKSRKWKNEVVRVGPLVIRKWLPNVAEPTAALQDRIPKNATEARLKLSKRRRTLNRLSIGSSLTHSATYGEVV